LALLSHRRFSVSCYSAPRHPHSFPTRRSSDLDAALVLPRSRRQPADRRRGIRPPPGPPDRRLTPQEEGRRVLWSRGRHVEELLRSEEHTSELQSRENLVCRLLLEKKNICHSSR